jgi:heptosyltransferase III
LSSASTHKLLVYLIGSLGDTIVAIPALRALRRHFPRAEFVLLQNEAPGGIADASSVIFPQYVDRVISYPGGAGLRSTKNLIGLWTKLRRERFDSVAYLVVSDRPENAVARDRYFFRSTGIRQLLGFHPFSRGELYPTGPDGMPSLTAHESLRKLQRLRRDGISWVQDHLAAPLLQPSDAEDERVASWLRHNVADVEGKDLVAISPGSKTQSNSWRPAKFADLGRKLAQNPSTQIVFTGGPRDVVLCHDLIREIGCGINAAGNFSIRETAALMSRCVLHIGVDTGTTHLAAAVGTRCISIHGGRTNPGQWFPMGEGHAVFLHPVICAGCQTFICPRPGHPCTEEISPDVIWQYAESMLNGDAGPGVIVV